MRASTEGNDRPSVRVGALHESPNHPTTLVADVGPCFTGVGRICPHVGQLRPTTRRVWPYLGRFGSELTNFRGDSGQFGIDFGPADWGTFALTRRWLRVLFNVRSGQGLRREAPATRLSGSSGRSRMAGPLESTKFDQCCPDLANIGPNSAHV